MKKQMKKLVLARETVRNLQEVRGGEIAYTASCGAVCYLSAPQYCPREPDTQTSACLP
jgi:hypothetical protein